jgi:hypothetical protein
MGQYFVRFAQTRSLTRGTTGYDVAMGQYFVQASRETNPVQIKKPVKSRRPKELNYIRANKANTICSP